jgi:hypothetical protein
MEETKMTNSTIDRDAVASTSRIDKLEHKVHDLEADLNCVVEIAYLRGATEWVRINYPLHYERLLMQYDSCAA